MSGRSSYLTGRQRRGCHGRRGGFRRPVGPQGGPLVPFPQAPLDVNVAIRVDGSWLDITPDVFGGNRAEINITRGRQNEASQVQPGRCTLQINNRNGLYSPRNPSSPLFGKIGRNTGIRVRIGADTRFRGEVPSWPVEWDKTGNDVWVDIEASGILRRLSMGTLSKPLPSSLTRLINAPVNADNVVVHWPAEDESDATTIATVTTGASAMTNITGLRFAVDNDGLPGSKPLAQAPANVFTHYEGKVPAYSASPTQIVAVDEYWSIAAGATSPNVNSLLILGWTGTVARWDIRIDDTNIAIIGVDALGVSVVSSVNAISSAWFGGFTLLRFELIENGANVEWDVYVSAVGAGATHYSGSYAGTRGTLTDVLNENLSPQAMTVGHMVVSVGTGLGWLAPADIGWRGETAANRFRRLCIEQGISVSIRGDRADSEPMGPQRAVALLDLLRECEATDGGFMYERRDLLSLVYRTRKNLYAQASGLELDYAARHIASVPTPVDDDQFTVNDVTISRVGGSKSRAVQTTGPLSTASPPNGVGVYDQDYSRSLYLDTQLDQQAAWQRHLGTVDEPRFPSIHVNLAKQVIATNPDLPAKARTVEMGDRLTIDNPPTWLPPEQISQLAIGFRERLNNFAHDISYVCRPASPFDQGVVEDSGFKIASDGSTVAAVVSDSATTWSVASTTDTPLWTTDSAEMPFDLMVAGERVTVTAISGGSSPQTFTVTRSVNGVVKSHAAGTTVQVFRPFRALL